MFNRFNSTTQKLRDGEVFRGGCLQATHGARNAQGHSPKCPASPIGECARSPVLGLETGHRSAVPSNEFTGTYASAFCLPVTQAREP